MAKLIIERTSQYANKFRSIHIYLNNQKIESLKDGEIKEIIVAEGNHEVFAKIDWCKTKPLKLALKKNEEKKLQLGSDLSGLNGLSALYKSIFDTSNFIYLKEV